MKKGQAAMEFLMTYGWALLVVIIAIAALIFFGILNPNQFLPERCTLSPGLSCNDYIAVDGVSGDNVTLVVQNGLGDDLIDFQVTLDECTNTYINASVVDGAITNVNISGCDFSVGERFKSDIVISYNSSKGNFRHEKTGSITTVAQ